MGWIDQITKAVGGLTDVFNLGRLIFYSAAGALIAYPVAAGLMVLAGPLKGQLFAELVAQAVLLTPAAMAGASVIVGFVISGAGFVIVLGPIVPRVKARAEARPIDRRGYPYRYPLLRNKPGTDYDAWLIQEYFRFVEIVAYIPLGLMGGLAALLLYAAAYVVAWTAAGHGLHPGAPHAAFLLIATTWSACAFGLWPHYWLPRVVEPVLETYHRAKLGISAALEERPETATSTQPAGGQPAKGSL